MSHTSDTTEMLINIIKAAVIIIVGFVLIKALLQAAG